MPKLEVRLPTRFINDIEKTLKGFDEICGEMVQAGGRVVYNNVMKNMPDVLKKSNFSRCIRLTKTYKMPKKPFFRKSFVKKDIFRAMYGVLVKYKLNSKS